MDIKTILARLDEDERVVLQIKSPLDPLVIRPVGRESDALFAVATMRP